MKILFYTTQLGHSYVRGTERYVTTLGTELRQRGHEVIYLAGDPLDDEKILRLGDCIDRKEEIYAIPTTDRMVVVGQGGKAVRDYLTSVKPDIVHISSCVSVGVGLINACRELGIPYVVTVHDFWWLCPKGTLLRPDKSICDGTPGWSVCTQCVAADHTSKRIQRLGRLPRGAAPLIASLLGVRGMKCGMPAADLLRWMRRRALLVDVLNNAHRVIFPSQAIADVYAQAVKTQHCQVVPNGLTSVWFEHRRPQQDLVLSPARFVVGYAGSLSRHKAPHLLLQAIRRLGWFDTTVRLVGPVGDSAYMKQLQKEASGLKVRFHGRVVADQMLAFLQGLDVVAVTSIWPESCPYVVLESQALGVPVVGSRVGGIIDQIGQDELLFEPGSRTGLADALEYARTHPQESKPQQVATISEMADAVQTIYDDALA